MTSTPHWIEYDKLYVPLILVRHNYYSLSVSEDEVEGAADDGEDDSSSGQERVNDSQRHSNCHCFFNRNTIIGNQTTCIMAIERQVKQ